MADTGTQVNNVAENNQAAEAKTFTQEQVDAMIGERLGRERAKYADYDELKAKADKFTKIEEANKGTSERPGEGKQAPGGA